MTHKLLRILNEAKTARTARLAVPRYKFATEYFALRILLTSQNRPDEWLLPPAGAATLAHPTGTASSTRRASHSSSQWLICEEL